MCFCYFPINCLQCNFVTYMLLNKPIKQYIYLIINVLYYLLRYEPNTPSYRSAAGGVPHNLQAGAISLSNAGLIIKWQTGWVWLDIVLPSEFLQRHAHLPSNKREKEDVKRNNYIRIKRPIPAAYSEIFFIGGSSILSTTCPFYTRRQKPVFGSNFHHRFSFSCLSGNGLL